VRTREVLSSDIQLGEIIIQILDYAGQLEEYVSHSLFAQDSEALFCVVCDISSAILAVKRRTSAWCSFVGGISQHKPTVLLAMTHLDKKPACEHERLILNLSNYLKKNHSNISIIHCARVNYRAEHIDQCLRNIKALLLNIFQIRLKGKFIPQSYALADKCLREESLKRNARKHSQIVSVDEVRALLVHSVPNFHDNDQFVLRVLKYLHYSGTILYSQHNKFVVLDPYRWLTNVLSLLLPEPEKQSRIPHKNGVMMLRDVSKYYKLFHCTRADVKRIMDLMCDYHLCICDRTQASNPAYVFPSLLPTIRKKILDSYWSVSHQNGEIFVGRVVTCKNAMDSISRGLFCSLQVRLNNEALFEHKDSTCVYFRNIILIRAGTGTIQVVFKRRNHSFQANALEILARGTSAVDLLRVTMRTILHHLHRFAPNLEMLWSAVCPCCMISSSTQHCLFPMTISRQMLDSVSEVKHKGSGDDISSRCRTCARTELCLNSSDKYVHRGIPNRALSAAQLLTGMMVSRDHQSQTGKRSSRYNNNVLSYVSSLMCFVVLGIGIKITTARSKVTRCTVFVCIISLC